MIIEYKIISDQYADNVTSAVNYDIRNGWQPHGSLVVLVDTEYSKVSYIQPMVMTDEVA